MLPDVKTILYCTQMGPNAAYAFRWAASLAVKLGARVVVLHVIETLNPVQEALVEGYAGKGALHSVVEEQELEAVERLHKRVEAFCARAAGEHFDPSLVASIVVVEGRVRRQILNQVEACGADLVVMGAHTRSSLIEGLLGSTAQKVITSCPVPVLVVQVPEGQQELTMIEP